MCKYFLCTISVIQHFLFCIALFSDFSQYCYMYFEFNKSLITPGNIADDIIFITLWSHKSTQRSKIKGIFSIKMYISKLLHWSWQNSRILGTKTRRTRKVRELRRKSPVTIQIALAVKIQTRREKTLVMKSKDQILLLFIMRNNISSLVTRLSALISGYLNLTAH